MAIQSAGLPNVTGLTTLGGIYSVIDANGALRDTKEVKIYSASHYNTGVQQTATIDFNASRSNPIYGSSTTVQPPSIKLIPQLRY